MREKVSGVFLSASSAYDLIKLADEAPKHPSLLETYSGHLHEGFKEMPNLTWHGLTEAFKGHHETALKNKLENVKKLENKPSWLKEGIKPEEMPFLERLGPAASAGWETIKQHSKPLSAVGLTALGAYGGYKLLGGLKNAIFGSSHEERR